MGPADLPDPRQGRAEEYKPLEESYHVHDRDMPEGFHHIKCCMLIEMNCAATFDLCMKVADALSTARRIGESISREINKKTMNCSGSAKGKE